MTSEDFSGDVGAPPRAEPDDALILDIEGFEGPLDLLLVLARTQKVDLRRISILELADQYLTFINQARRLEIEVAADYLVMASWLAYLKSKLLLPDPHAGEGPTGEELAARLAFRLQRLEAMRQSATRLFGRDRLGRDIFSRGSPEGVRIVKTPQYADNLVDLLKAYSDERKRKIPTRLHIVRAPVYAIEDARKRLERMLGIIVDWSRLDSLVPDEYRIGVGRRSGLASTFLASLEMVRDGQLELRQANVFGPIYIKRKVQPEPTRGVA